MDGRASEFSFIPVLSNPQPAMRWQGRTGFVHQAGWPTSPICRDTSVPCGAPVMVDTARDSFVKMRNLPEDEFFADPFIYAADAETETAS